MTKLIYNKKLPVHLDRDEFLTPFDKIFDHMMGSVFPNFKNEVGINFEQGAYPRVNVYEYDDKLSIVAEIPGLDKKDVQVSTENGILTIAGDKHGAWEDEGAKVVRRELKQSSFKRSFALGENLDEKKLSAKFTSGVLVIDIEKKEPEKPEKTFVKIK